MLTRPFLFCIAFGLLAILPVSARAHGLGVACAIRGDKVEVEAFYDDDSAAAKAKVVVVNAKDEVVATGITDEQGLWKFAKPEPGKYEVRVDAGAGHRAKKTLNVPRPDTSSEEPAAEPSREEQTQTPWLGVGLGLAAIAGGGGAIMLVMMLLGVRGPL